MSLRDELARRIAASGPISLADYMSECLMHPTHGYYTTRMPFGTQGDFVTAPEVSQMFGELIGLCLAQTWMDQGAPAPFTLAELGPGRGTLMTDVLRATASVSGFHAAARVNLVEASEKMRALQTATLGAYKITHLDDVAQLPEQPLFLVANEFFDALPLRQFQRSETGWQERVVGLDEDGALRVGLAPQVPQPALKDRLADTRPGDIVEYAPAAGPTAAAVGARIAHHGGAALIVDYGDWISLGDTFQAVAGHAPANPFAAPGEVDLTAQVDFAAIANAAPCAHSRLTPQGVFLERLGITARAQQLAERMSGAALEAHVAAHRRLTHPNEMGNLFKVLGLFPEDQPPPPGLDA